LGRSDLCTGLKSAHQQNKIQLGLRENRKQFALLVLVNAFVGGMIGMERTIIPEYAETVIGIASARAILSFITAFGISKAFANYYTGRLANRYGRKKLLILGWIIALPIPWILIYAPSYSWVIPANILLGINQGMTWSSTVVMKIDLVGEKNRGLAMGLNEFAGYLAVGIVAYSTALIAKTWGITPYPFYLGVFISVSGLLLSVLWVKDTRVFSRMETATNEQPMLKNVFLDTSYRNPTLGSVTQAGLVNNLNDGMIWGLLPMLLASYQFNTDRIGMVAGIYPLVWGMGQLFTGKMSDHFSKKRMLWGGMLLQAFAILLLPFNHAFAVLIGLSAILGLGTAFVYPTFLAAIASATRPEQRAESIGTFRLWRDLGYAIGAVISGIVADNFGIAVAIMLIGVITLLSALLIWLRMPSKISPN
jgi:MFS family permease